MLRPRRGWSASCTTAMVGSRPRKPQQSPPRSPPTPRPQRSPKPSRSATQPRARPGRSSNPGPVPLALARRVTEAARARPAARPMFSGWRAAAAVVVALGLGTRGDGTDAARSWPAPGRVYEASGNSDPAWKPALVSALGQEPALAEVDFKDGKARVAITRWFDTGTRDALRRIQDLGQRREWRGHRLPSP